MMMCPSSERLASGRPDFVTAITAWSGSGKDEGVAVTGTAMIGGAVIRAARRSARLSRRRLARLLGVTPGMVRAWEAGTVPLFCLPYSQLRQLAAGLHDAGTRVGQELGELLLASQCDLLITGMLGGFEDYSEVPPVDEQGSRGDSARAFVRWAVTGAVPQPYRPYARPGALLAAHEVDRFAAQAHNLNAGAAGDALVTFGACLVALTH
jgi:transcriptional regulator with XRE-family HTH domain